MGGYPLHALNIAEFPSDILPLEILTEILKGGLDIASKAGIPILGGHTIKDPVPKYGLSVTGKVKKKNLTLNSNSKVGDSLILTKPLGLGIISTAIKNDAADPRMIKDAINVMIELNKDAAEAMNTIGVNSCTDITGYGLLGHLLEMSNASNLSASINYAKVPRIEGVNSLIQTGFIPGGTKRNLDHIAKYLNPSNELPKDELYLLADSQTSGGLLISVAEDKAEELQNLLISKSTLASSIIGSMHKRNNFAITIS